MAAFMLLALLLGIVGASYAVWRVGTREARRTETAAFVAESPIDTWRHSRLGPVTSPSLGLPLAAAPMVATALPPMVNGSPAAPIAGEPEVDDEGPSARRRELERQALADEEAHAALAREHDEDDEDWMAERFGGAWAGFGGSSQLYD